MKLRNSFVIRFILPLFTICFFFFLGAIDIWQTTTVKSDGSGSIILSYLAPDSSLVKTKQLGNYVFTETEARANFSSPNTDVKSVGIYFHDAMTHAVIKLDFKDINKLSEVKGFSDMKISWTKEGSEMNFQWIVPQKQLENNFLGELYYIFNFNGDIIASNGEIKGDSVTYLINPTNSDYTKDIVFSARVVPGEDEDESSPKSSCGLFAIEFPLILVGLVFYVKFEE